MRAVVHERFGRPADVLRVRDVDTPVAEEGEVLVRVRAAGVAKGDWLITAGQPYIARPSHGIRTPKQRIAGLEMAGVVEAVGPGTSDLEPGDEVFGWCNGAFADYVAVDRGQLASKPSNVTFEQTATVPISGIAALHAVRDQGEVRSGQAVLVIGASGGVGSMAVQVAKAHGAEVTGVCSTRNVDLVRSIGADHVIDYTKEEVGDGGRRYDAIVDIAGNRSISSLRSVLTPEGTLVVVGGTGGPVTMGFGRTVWAMMLSPFVGQRLRSLLSSPNQEDLNVLKDLLESGDLVPVVDRTYSLDETPEAVAEVGGGRSQGKRVITISSE
jgi:NADPH:quinone reductase-like Zn-dependent oxidoreductase